LLYYVDKTELVVLIVDIFKIITKFLTIGIIVLPIVATTQQLQSNQPIVLNPLVVKGDKIDRSLNQTSAGTTIIDGEEANASKNQDIDDVVDAEANILANEGFSLPSIRGVDSTSGGRPSITAGSQPRTPIVVDNVALPSNESSIISELSLWDTSTVEVARGPQPTSTGTGTGTGRNAIGGAIRVFTNDPAFEQEAAARLGYFNQDGTASAAFMFNTPFADDQLALRITGELSRGESYVEYCPSYPRTSTLKKKSASA